MYDVLLDDYEKGMTVARLEAVFQQARVPAAAAAAFVCVSCICLVCATGWLFWKGGQ